MSRKLERIEDDLDYRLSRNEPYPVFFDPFDTKSGITEEDIHGRG